MWSVITTECHAEPSPQLPGSKQLHQVEYGWLKARGSLFIGPVIHEGFPASTNGKGPISQCRRHKRCRFNPWVRKIPWSREWHPTPVAFLPEKFYGQKSLAGYSLWGPKSRTQLSTCAHTHLHTQIQQYTCIAIFTSLI